MNKISIIMRTSRRYIFLERAIKDVLAQSYKEWQLIVVNDGGDIDKVEAIINELHVPQAQYKIITNEKNMGLYKAINLGAKAVNTEFVVIHDDDDTWHSDFLLETINYLEAELGCMAVVTHIYKVYEKVEHNSLKVQKRVPLNFELKDVISMYDMIRNNLFAPIAFVYRASVYQEIGFYDESLEVLEDWEFNLRFLMKYDIHVIEKPLAYYHIRRQGNIQGSYQNTVVAKKKLHQKYDTIIRNRYLRKDLDNKQIGIGILLNVLRKYDGRVMKVLKRYMRW